jgi:putative ABC transport system substrate-binding protein
MNHRRHMLVAFGAAALAELPGALAQHPAKPSGKIWRIGFMWAASRATTQASLDSILRKLREFGYVEGRDFVAEHRWADGNAKLLPGFAAELVGLKVDLLFTYSTEAAQAAKAATRDIPVVFTMVSDPVASKVVNTLAHPGGNLTGWSNMLPDSSEKLLEFLRTIKPRMAQLVVLSDPGNPGKVLEVTRLRAAVERLGLTLRPKDVRNGADVDSAFVQMARERPDALIVLVDGVTTTHRQRIVDLAARHRLPAIYQVREFVEAGGLMSYGLNIGRQQERTAEYMHRIFKGAKPSDLPVEQPTRIELVINRKAVAALGVTVAPELLLRADEVIE